MASSVYHVGWEEMEDDEGGGGGEEGGRRRREKGEKREGDKEIRGGHLSPRWWPHPAWGVRRQVCGRWCRVCTMEDGGQLTTASFEFFHSKPSISVHLIGQKNN